jgi:dipeptidyl aminopeptidase/acylaminoacyl peptidase
VYSSPGYLLFARDRTLMAQPFDAGKLQTTGDAIPIAEQVDSNGGRAAQNQFSISQNGVLAYTSGVTGGSGRLTWFDRSGKVAGTLGAPNVTYWGAISPDGMTVAVDRTDQGLTDIWLHDLTRGTATRFTFGPTNNEFPVWSTDGSHIAFYSVRDGIGRPFERAITGSAKVEVLSQPLGEPPHNTRLDDWSRDGRYLILNTAGDPKTKNDVWVLPTFGDRKAYPYLQSEFSEVFAKLSPDGRWLAYTSDESKRREIYVQSFPTPGGKWQVSTNGGERSVWSKDGRELYFVSPDGKMMAAEVKSGSKFEAGVPKPLFDVRLAAGGLNNVWFDVGKDGRFLIPVQAEQSATAPMTVVVNWQAALKK